MNIYRTICLIAVILAPAYTLANSVNAQANSTNVDIAENSDDVENGRFYVPARITIPVGATVVWNRN